jgi:ABC-type antimicrobial peptide transport system permease subunit
MVLRDVLVQGAVGIVVGIPIAFAGGQLVANQLYRVSPTDPTMPAAAASYSFSASPSQAMGRRDASRIDPIRALRQE